MNMKRVSLVLVITIAIACLLTGCCDHEYVGEITRYATFEDPTVETNYKCINCNKSYVEVTEKECISIDMLSASLSAIRYKPNANGLSRIRMITGHDFSINIGNLVNRGVSNYELVWYTAMQAKEEGITKQFPFPLKKCKEGTDLSNLYYAVISGDVEKHPDFPGCNEYKDYALWAWLEFDDEGKLVDYDFEVCTDLDTYAYILVTS